MSEIAKLKAEIAELKAEKIAELQLLGAQIDMLTDRDRELAELREENERLRKCQR